MIEVNSRRRVFSGTFAGEVAVGEVGLGTAVVLVGGFFVPSGGHAHVAGNTCARFVAVAEVALGDVVAGIGCHAVELGGTVFVDGQATFAEFIGYAEIERCQRLIAFDGNLIVVHGFGHVFRGASAEFVAKTYYLCRQSVAGIGKGTGHLESFGIGAFAVESVGGLRFRFCE